MLLLLVIAIPVGISQSQHLGLRNLYSGNMFSRFELQYPYSSLTVLISCIECTRPLYSYCCIMAPLSVISDYLLPSVIVTVFKTRNLS